jgi:hypothetical protein
VSLFVSLSDVGPKTRHPSVEKAASDVGRGPYGMTLGDKQVSEPVATNRDRSLKQSTAMYGNAPVFANSVAPRSRNPVAVRIPPGSPRFDNGR